MTSAPASPAPPTAPPAGAAPPHSIEAEQAVLGGILLSEQAHYAFVVEEALKAEDFYRARHKVIYGVMAEMFGAGTEIDTLSVVEELKSRGKLEDAGGPAEIGALVTAVPAVGNLRRYAEIVKQSAHLRRLLDASYRIQSSVYAREGEPQDIVDAAERTILEIRMGEAEQGFEPVGSVLQRELQRWDQLSKDGTAITGVPSGFPDLDTITGGFQPGNLIIIAARPSMGKSALVTNIAENVALDKKDPRPVALFSLEMSEGELAQRFIASQASIKGDDLRKGRVRDEKWQRVLRAAGEYDQSKLFIDDSSDVSLLDIRAKARRLHQSLHDQGGLGLIIIDYLQLMRADTRYDSRVQQVGEMSRGLKILARELKVPGDRALAALARRRVADRQAPDALRPARVRPDRAGRGPRDVHLPRRLLQPRGLRGARRQRAHPRQAPQRRPRRREAHLPARVPALPQHSAGGRVSRACALGVCDGSGWIDDEAAGGVRACRCRPQLVASRRARALSAVIPRRYQGVSFERPPVTDMPRPQVDVVRAYVRRLDERLAQGRGLWFYGGVGTGKTTLAMLVSRHALDAGRTVAIYSLPRLLAEIRETYESDARGAYTHLLDRLTEVDLLHVDDLGAEKTSPWVLEQLYAIVNARYEAEQAMLVTTNLERDALAEQIGERTVSRLEEMCEVCPLFGRDQRRFEAVDQREERRADGAPDLRLA